MAREKKDALSGSMENDLRNLYKLQTILSEIDAKRELRGELPLEVNDLEDEIEGLTTRMEKIQGEIGQAKEEKAACKAAIQTNLAKIERYNEQLNNVRNNREYENLSREIEYFKLDNESLEKRLRDLDARQERYEAEIRDCSDKVTEHRTELDIKKGELDEIMAETRAEEERLREEAKDLETSIDSRLLVNFKRTRKNLLDGRGVVYVRNGACGGCCNKIPPQRQLDIRMRKKPIVCEYCGRILVDPELAGVQVDKPAEKPKRSSRRRKADAED